MNRSDLQPLLSRPVRFENSVLSVYLNVDQSRQANLNRGFEIQLNDMLAGVQPTIAEASELERFGNAARRIRDFVSTWTIEANNLALFFDTSDGFFWTRELRVPLPNQCRWGRTPFLQPLEAALDEGAAYVVALVGYTNMRLLAISMGIVEEVVESTFTRDIRHLRTVGTDHLGQSSNLQHKADENIRRNLREIVREIDTLMQSRAVKRLILAGTRKVTAELRKMLPKRLFMRVIGDAQIGTDAPVQEILAVTQEVVETYKRDSEGRLVRELITTANKTHKAVTGLGPTLKAVNDGRVWQLVYSDAMRSCGFECPKCSALFSLEGRSCPMCGTTLLPVQDVVERVIESAFRKGAAIEVVKGPAAEALKDEGGIGALLRVRTTVSSL